MVETKLIQETIIELMDANIDKETIFSTLRDIGVGDQDIEVNYKEVLSTRDVKNQEPVTTKEKENNINDNTEVEEDELDDIDEEDIEEEVKKEPIKNIKKNILEENKKRDETFLETELKKTTQEVKNINDKDIFEDIKKEKNNEININAKQLSEIEEQIRDLKAQMNGLTKIMKDILEENRNILNKIK